MYSLSGDNALHTAARRGNLVEVRSQVRNFDINAKGFEDGTALYGAAEKGHADVVKFLLTFNPGVNIPDVSTLKMTSVHYLISISPIPHICFVPFFLHLLACIVITHSRRTTYYHLLPLLQFMLFLPPTTTHDMYTYILYSPPHISIHPYIYIYIPPSPHFHPPAHPHSHLDTPHPLLLYPHPLLLYVPPLTYPPFLFPYPLTTHHGVSLTNTNQPTRHPILRVVVPNRIRAPQP